MGVFGFCLTSCLDSCNLKYMFLDAQSKQEVKMASDFNTIVNQMIDSKIQLVCQTPGKVVRAKQELLLSESASTSLQHQASVHSNNPFSRPKSRSLQKSSTSVYQLGQRK